MSELREKVAGVLLRQVQRRIGFDEKDCKSLKEMGDAGNDYYGDADAAIAAMRDALLSDEVVEAGAEGVYRVDGEGLYIFQDGKERRVEWQELTALHRAQTRKRSRAALNAAIAALGHGARDGRHE